MRPRAAAPLLLAVAALGACGSSSSGTAADAATSAAGTISGTVHGSKWASFSNAYWIGKPSAGAPPVIAFLFEGPMDCATLINPNWDKTALGDRQLLEIGVLKTTPGTFKVPMDASVAYLHGAYNPSADTGTVTIDELHASKNLVGSFAVMFMGDALEGTFDATFCADGVEP